MNQRKSQEERMKNDLETLQEALKTAVTKNKELSKELEILNGDTGLLVLMLCDQGEIMGRMLKFIQTKTVSVFGTALTERNISYTELIARLAAENDAMNIQNMFAQFDRHILRTACGMVVRNYKASGLDATVDEKVVKMREEMWKIIVAKGPYHLDTIDDAAAMALLKLKKEFESQLLSQKVESPERASRSKLEVNDALTRDLFMEILDRYRDEHGETGLQDLLQAKCGRLLDYMIPDSRPIDFAKHTVETTQDGWDGKDLCKLIGPFVDYIEDPDIRTFLEGGAASASIRTSHQRCEMVALPEQELKIIRFKIIDSYKRASMAMNEQSLSRSLQALEQQLVMKRAEMIQQIQLGAKRKKEIYNLRQELRACQQSEKQDVAPLEAEIRQLRERGHSDFPCPIASTLSRRDKELADRGRELAQSVESAHDREAKLKTQITKLNMELDTKNKELEASRAEPNKVREEFSNKIQRGHDKISALEAKLAEERAAHEVTKLDSKEWEKSCAEAQTTLRKVRDSNVKGQKIVADLKENKTQWQMEKMKMEARIKELEIQVQLAKPIQNSDDTIDQLPSILSSEASESMEPVPSEVVTQLAKEADLVHEENRRLTVSLREREVLHNAILDDLEVEQKKTANLAKQVGPMTVALLAAGINLPNIE